MTLAQRHCIIILVAQATEREGEQNMKKHLLLKSVLTILLFAICFTMLPIEAAAAKTSDLTFTLNSDGAGYTVTKCKQSASGKLVIPETYKDLPVTAIAERVFVSCPELTEIVIGNNVTNLGEFLFTCDNLKSVTLGSGVHDINSYKLLSQHQASECTGSRNC